MDQVKTKQEATLKKTNTPQSLNVYHVQSNNLLQSTFIIDSPAALQILLEPWLVGSQLSHLARRSSVDFLRAAYMISNEMRDATYQQMAEVIPLAGSLHYSLAEAFEELFGEILNRSFVGAKRRLSDTGWITDLSYLNFEALPRKPVIIIGDTIATGSTIISIIDATMKQAQDPKALIIYSIAGGMEGAIRISDFTQDIGIPTYLFYSNAIFGVASNGTDMPWLHPATLSTPDTIQSAVDAYGLYLAAKWCSIWDWGDRAKHPVKHLEELREICLEELRSCEVQEVRLKLEFFLTKVDESLGMWKSRIDLV